MGPWPHRSPILATLLALGSLAAQAQSLNTLIQDSMKQQIRDKSQGSGSRRYFMTVFGYQDEPNRPGNSHTFATFTEVLPSGEQRVSTISWLPADFEQNRKLCVFRGLLSPLPGLNACPPVVGKNFSLEDTLRYAVDGKRDVGMWGPYEVQKSLFDAGKARIASLQRGDLKYLADDRVRRQRGEAVNCLHAVSDLGGTISENGGAFKSEFGIWGINGTKHILKHFSKQGESWLKDPVELARYQSFVYRPDTSGALDSGAH